MLVKSLKEQVTVHGQIKLHEDTKGVKTPTKKKKPMVSRIRREELQQEETNGVKNPPRRITARRNQWRQESAKKTQQEETISVKTPTEKKPSLAEGVVSETSGILH